MKLTKKNVALAVGAPLVFAAILTGVDFAEKAFGPVAMDAIKGLVMLALIGWAAVAAWGDE